MTLEVAFPKTRRRRSLRHNDQRGPVDPIVPSAKQLPDYQELARLKPGEPSVYARILGSIPAEESDEAFEAALADLR